MELIPPRISGPLSECSRTVVFQNALPGATVVLVRIREGAPQEVGKATATQSGGAVALQAGEVLATRRAVVRAQTARECWEPPGADAVLERR